MAQLALKRPIIFFDLETTGLDCQKDRIVELSAKKLNPENPRVYLLEGQDKFYTPEQYGGSKSEAKQLFEQATKKYDSFKPASDIDPNWGRGMIQYLMTQMK